MTLSIYYIAFLKIPILYTQQSPITTQINIVSVFEITHFLPTFLNNVDINDTIKKVIT